MLLRYLPVSLLLVVACGAESAPTSDNAPAAVLETPPTCAYEGFANTSAAVEHDAALQPDYQMDVVASGWPQRQLVLRLTGNVSTGATFDLSQQGGEDCTACITGEIGSGGETTYKPVAGTLAVEQIGTAKGEDVGLSVQGLILESDSGERWCAGDNAWTAAIEPWSCTEATRLKGQVHTYRNHETVCFGDDVFLCQKVSDFEERSRAELTYVSTCAGGCDEAIPGRAECNLE